MPSPLPLVGSVVLLGVGLCHFAAAAPPVRLADVQEGLPIITSDEPLASSFSAENAAAYLDRAALNWQKTKKCATCHTNLFYMAARPALSEVTADSGEVRAFYEDYLKVRWETRKPKEPQGFCRSLLELD